MHSSAPIRVTAIAALIATAALACAAPAGARLPGGAEYAGQTEEDLGVSVRLGGSGRYIARLRIEYHLTCDNGAEGTPSTTVFDVRIRDRGRFAYKGTYRGREDGAKNRVELRGRVTRKVAKGTFELTAVGRPQGSDERVRCETELISWRAERER